jgi:aminopeptidase
MRDPRVEKLANLLVDYSIGVRPGEQVAIRSWTPAEPLLNALYARILAAGGHPFLLLKFPDTEQLLFDHASEEQLKLTSSVEQFVVDTFDAVILVRGEANTKALSNVEARRLLLARQAEGPLMQKTMQRAAAGSLRWTSTLFPTHAYAQDAAMSLAEYEDFVYRACMPDLEDPVGYWTQVQVRQAKITEWLKGKREVHLLADGTDLRLSIAGRRWENACCKNNVPDGEINTSPVEDSANGTVRFSFPAIYHGREIDGVRLWFENGQVVRAEADKNEDYVHEALSTDAGARYLGEFAIGTNEGIDRFTGQILFDEKIGGTFHLALGNAYPVTGGTNRSAIHWDLICDLRQGGEIRVDGELLVRDGRFVPNF